MLELSVSSFVFVCEHNGPKSFYTSLFYNLGFVSITYGYFFYVITRWKNFHLMHLQSNDFVVSYTSSIVVLRFACSLLAQEIQCTQIQNHWICKSQKKSQIIVKSGARSSSAAWKLDENWWEAKKGTKNHLEFSKKSTKLSKIFSKSNS